MELNRIYNQDCMEGMRDIPDGYFHLAIVDPPYGIGESGQTNKTRSKLAKSKDYGNKSWDNQSHDEQYFKELMRVSHHQIIFGANHFISKIPIDSSCWIVWDKVNGENDFADCELAWTSFKTAVRQVRYMWNGMRQGKSLNEGHIMQGNKELNEKRIHPTQKPVALYKWLLSKFANPGDKIIDTHAGGCSSVIACIDLGFDYLAYELDSQMFKMATKRVLDYQRQIRIPYAG